MDEEKYIERITGRYFRKTIAHPKGSICHHGDCHIFSSGFCTCGLLHDLVWLQEKAEELFPDFWEQRAIQDHRSSLFTLLRCQGKVEAAEDDGDGEDVVYFTYNVGGLESVVPGTLPRSLFDICGISLEAGTEFWIMLDPGRFEELTDDEVEQRREEIERILGDGESQAEEG